MLIRPVDWPKVMAAFRSQGLSFAAVSSGSGVSKSTLVRLGNGYDQPVHVNGERVIAYWQQQTGKTREELPFLTL